ncbi:MAG: FxsA family protein [Snodgrassella sp.]|jgi:UPF0716 protein FxsA|nr:FxsA family protein [Snodgrassella sp.]
MRYISRLLLVVAILEVISIIIVTHFIGGSWTLFLMVLSIFCGLSMLRNTGISGLFVFMSTINSRNKISLYQLLWPFRFILAALLLISPGFFSDLIAAVLLLPIRGKPLTKSTTNPFQNHTSANNDDIIEGEFTVDFPNQETSAQQHHSKLPPK